MKNITEDHINLGAQWIIGVLLAIKVVYWSSELAEYLIKNW